MSAKPLAPAAGGTAATAAWDRTMDDLARGARTAHVAVAPPSGPHTTPVAVAWAGGRLWFLTPRRSVKARAAHGAPMAALLWSGQATLLLRGHGEVLDPLRPAAALRASGARLLPASLRYLRTQAGETAAITRDALLALARELDTAPLGLRSAVALTPVEAVPLGSAGPPEAVLTLDTARGPLPLPVTVHGRSDRVRLTAAAALFAPSDGRPTRACLTVVTADEPGLRGKAGTLTRGMAVLSADRRTATLTDTRVTWWRGGRSGTLRPAGAREQRHVR